jgi:hypothetical protein
VLENRVLRGIFRPRRDEVMGGWRKLHNEELHNFYYSPSVIEIIKSRRMRWTGHVTCVRERRNIYRILVETPEGKRPLGRPRRGWEDNITIRSGKKFTPTFLDTTRTALKTTCSTVLLLLRVYSLPR